MSETTPSNHYRKRVSRRQNAFESDSESESTSLFPSDSQDDRAAPVLAPRPHQPPQQSSDQDSRIRERGRLDVFGEEQLHHFPHQEHAYLDKSAPRARKSVRASRRSTLQRTESLQPDYPSSASPRHSEALLDNAAPLGDITEAVVNEQSQHLAPVRVPQPKSLDILPQPEKPMEIVIRARAKAITQPQVPQQDLRRTVITYLVLKNFKSYAGRQEVGPFHASFSSVVGPNGSGKSNVIDSLLFVFGFRASKMRQGKISSLIHNSAAFPDLDNCEVEVHFEEVEDLPNGSKEVIPGSALVISRKAFRNNSSKYYINSKESNFTAVTSLLKDRGVDLDHKRFLILQGEVESIAQMKPKAANEHDDGLLEYLEDIIGTSKYKGPIEESTLETETLNEVCIEKNSRVQHVEKEKKSLEAKKNAAIAYIRDENDLAIKQSALCQIFVHECIANVQVTEEAIEQMQAQLNAELEKHQGSEEGIRQLENQYKVHTKQFQKLEEAAQTTLKHLTKVDKETVKIEEKRKHMDTKLRKIEKTRATSEAAISEASTNLQRLFGDIERNTTEISTIEETLHAEERELEGVRDSLRGKTESLSDEITGKQKQLEPWTAQINDQKSKIAVAQSELRMLEERDKIGGRALTDVEARLKHLQTERAEKILQITGHNTQREALQDEMQRLQTTMDKLCMQEPRMQARVSIARQKMDEARSSLAKSQTQGNVLAGLTRLKESGRIEGFHGRLGNLGTIDQKYDVAISTACPSLENLVVDTVEVGQCCIEYLRKNNLGRANFVLLDRLAQRDLSRIETPEDVPRLFDLVVPKEDRFRPAFYSVLQNTLVAQDLEQANRIAYGHKRWRVVTLDGQLIDKSGTMSGGGTRVAKGAMSSKLVNAISKEQVANLEAEQETEEQKYQEFQQEILSMKTSIRSAQDDIPLIETQLQRWHLEVDSIDRNLADCKRRQRELEASNTPDLGDRDRIGALQKSIKQAEGAIITLQENTGGIEHDIRVLQDKIMEIGGVKLRMQKAKVDGLKERIATLSDEMSCAEANHTKTQKQLAKHQKSKLEAENDLVAVSVEMEKLLGEAERFSQEGVKLKEQAEEAEEALESRKNEMRLLKAEVEQKTDQLNQTRGAEIEMRNKVEDSQKALSENMRRLDYWQEKMSNLKIQDLSDIGEESEQQFLATFTRDELADLDKTVLKGEIAMLEEKTQNTDVDLGVIDEYRRRVEEHAERSGDLAHAVAARDTAKRRSEELRRLRLEGFMEGFSTISLRLKEMYQMITMGGNAELELVDSLDPFSEGILFSVMPPKKSWKNISNLSGGEKTLSSLALVFALHHYKPTPLYVMDEIDAALDFRNVSIVASYIKERTKNAQFIVISLRNNMFELASRLVGVYKVNQMTKSVTVENRDYIVRT